MRPSLLRALAAVSELFPPTEKKKGLVNKAKRFLAGATLPASLEHYRTTADAANFITNAGSVAPGLTDHLLSTTYMGSNINLTATSDGSQPLKATIVWTDPAGAAQGGGVDVRTPALFNDLDGDDWDEPDDDNNDDDNHVAEYGPCPECGEEMDVEAEMCPACGHWLSTAERHKLWDGGSTAKAALSVGQKVLVIVLAVLFLGSMFGMIW